MGFGTSFGIGMGVGAYLNEMGKSKYEKEYKKALEIERRKIKEKHNNE